MESVKTKLDVYGAVDSYGDHYYLHTLKFKLGRHLKKGLALFFYRQLNPSGSKNKKKFKAPALKLKEIAEANGFANVNIAVLTSVLHRCYKVFSAKITKPNRHWEKIVSFLDEEFECTGQKWHKGIGETSMERQDEDTPVEAAVIPMMEIAVVGDATENIPPNKIGNVDIDIEGINVVHHAEKTKKKCSGCKARTLSIVNLCPRIHL